MMQQPTVAQAQTSINWLFAVDPKRKTLSTMSMAFHATLTLAAKAAKKAVTGGERPLALLSSRLKLKNYGLQALLPSVHPKYKDGEQDVAKLSVKERVWRPPMLNARKINNLRRIAKVEGTYGAFNPETLKGWDPQWDLQLAILRSRSTGRYMQLRKPKLTASARTREARAQRIDDALVGMDERMEALQEARSKAKKKDHSIMAKLNRLLAPGKR